ncbi:MAG: MXAN_6640 family putative metalloprotease [Deltaproteobacteria bacterium]
MGIPRRLTAGRIGLAAALSMAGATSCTPDDPTATSVQQIRPDRTGAGWPAFQAGETLETFASAGGGFLIHFTRAGFDAVPTVDADSNGTPDFVEQAAGVYDNVLAFYHDMHGFRAPPSDLRAAGGNGGDGRFDVYLVNFDGHSDGAFRQDDGCNPTTSPTCSGYMLQDNDFAEFGYPSTLIANRILASHEFFHAIQAGYDTRRDTILSESTAAWGTRQYARAVDPALVSDFNGFVPGFMATPERSLDAVQTGPVDSFAYGAALFPEFLSERHSFDFAIVERLWAACGTDDGTTSWLVLLDQVLQRDYATSFAAEYGEFAVWNLYTAARANPTRAYADGAQYPLVATTAAALPFSNARVRFFHAASRYYRSSVEGRTTMTAALVAPPDAAPDFFQGVQVRLAVQRGNVLDEPRSLASVADGTETVDTTGASLVITLVSDVNTGGQSKVVGLCIGTPAEVAECRSTLVAAQDAGVPADASDASAETDVVDAAADGGITTRPPGCACRTAGPARHAPRGLGLIALLGLALAARGQRVTVPASTPSRPTGTRSLPTS